MSLDIVIKTIPHEGQRYATVGDWQWKSDGRLVITVSDMKDWKKEFLVVFHELAEVMLCRARGITQEQVDRFDIDYEASVLRVIPVSRVIVLMPHIGPNTFLLLVSKDSLPPS